MNESQGVVVSAKMRKTVVVRTERLVQHPVYKKYVVRRTNVKARDELGCHEGDVVALVPSRPLARGVTWRITKIVGRRSVSGAGEEQPA